MTVAVDIRAKTYCSLGPVISGSLSDTYAQNAGLIFTRGSVEIAKVIRPRVGTAVQFAYLKGTRLSRLPRHVVVLSSFADPFRGKTTVQLGCLLTYLENRKPPPEDETANSKEENGDVPCSVYLKATLSITASFIAQKIMSALGLSGSLPSLTNTFNTEEFDLSSGYVSVLGNLLVSECFIGFMNPAGEFTFKSLLGLPTAGPLLEGNALIDIGPIGTGELPGDSVLVRYSSQRLKKPDENEDDDTAEQLAKRDWEWEEVFGPLQEVSVSYYDEESLVPSEVLVRAAYVPYTFVATTYDRWDRAVMRISLERSVLAETNNRYATDLYRYGTIGLVGGFSAVLLRPTDKVQFTRWTYKVTSEGGTSAVDLYETLTAGGPAAVKAALGLAKEEEDEKTAAECLEEETKPEGLEDVEQERSVTLLTEAELAGTLNLDTYTFNAGAPLFDSLQAILLRNETNIIESVTLVTYDKDQASGITKTKTTQLLIYGKTTTGQQDLATEIKDAQENEDPDDIAVWIEPILAKAQVLRNNGAEIRIRTEREYGLQKRPSRDERNASGNAIPSPAEQVAETAWAMGAASTNFIEFSMPYAPDDRITWSPTTGYSSVSSDAGQKALNFGRVQNRILLGNRNGISIQIPAKLMPPFPLDPVYISATGLTGAYLLNGTTYSFDANGIIGSADCLFWGAAA